MQFSVRFYVDKGAKSERSEARKDMIMISRPAYIIVAIIIAICY